MLAPISINTLIDLLEFRASSQSAQHAYTFLIDGKKESTPLTYADLQRQAKAIAATLQEHQVKGERALLLYPQGLEVVAAFCGCLYAGVIAIPVPPPESGRLKRTLPRLRSIVKDAQASIVLTNGAIFDLVANVEAEFPEFAQMRWINTEKIQLNLAEQWQNPQINPDSLAYLQYTSGSTSTPKGVMLSHHNLIHHCRYLQRACGYNEQSVTLTWMPYFHDYGLVEGLMVPLYNGHPCYLMSPFAFIKRPLHWLVNISKYGVTHSQAPNFAYDLCVKKIKDKQISELNLSSWEAAGNAAEPINPRVMLEFADKFAPAGFQWTTFAPAYGLAEYTLLVSSKPKGTKPVFCAVESSSLEQDHIVIAAPDQEEGVRIIPSCGQLVCETEVAIVHPDTLTRCTESEVGEIWVKDQSVAQGYWQRTEETDKTFRAYIKDTGAGPFLRTGDLGFFWEGELYINGRIKDLIIIRGSNHYPQDLEWSVQHLDPVLRSDYGAAFSVEIDGEERLVIVQEIERKAQNLDTDKLIADIRQEIAEEHELQVYAIVLAKSGTILKTASGKIQRRAIQANFLAGKIEAIADWCEDIKQSLKYKNLEKQVETLEKQVKT
jgi:acyl-CoA synthetase (AMP-forming)/AMP-acid ligase II